jgi:hypothetical protein
MDGPSFVDTMSEDA